QTGEQAHWVLGNVPPQQRVVVAAVVVEQPALRVVILPHKPEGQPGVRARRPVHLARAAVRQGGDGQYQFAGLVEDLRRSTDLVVTVVEVRTLEAPREGDG